MTHGWEAISEEAATDRLRGVVIHLLQLADRETNERGRVGFDKSRPVSREHGGQLCRAEPELYQSPLMSAADQRKWVPLDEQKKKGPVIAWGMTGPERVGSCILVGKFLDELFLSTVRSTWRRSDTRHPPR